MPGPMVVETVTDLMYVPFADGGLSLQQRLEHRARVVAQLVAAERRLADAGVHDAGLLDAELDAAGLELAHRLGDVVRHRADLRVRHQARGPSTRPRRPTRPIMSGVATIESNSSQFSF